MATVKAIKYGMKGDDVSNLQTYLKNAGYNVDVDGSFGSQTLAAVKQYQQANGLTVDGMVGPQTQAKLFGNTSTPTNTPAGTNTGAVTGGAGSAASAATNVNYPDPPTYDQYVAPERVVSDTVNQAYDALQSILAAQPGAYQSKWQSQLDDIIGRILNREAFNYDFNEDALYKQYAEQYMRRGKLAMQDTMGQAAAMTGGYGNSYASTAGNQAFQEYISQLNEVIPELYGMALDRYKMEGQEMYNQFGLLSDREAQDYGRHQDAYNKWLAERDYAAGRYDTESERDYSKYVDERNFERGVYADDRDQAFNEYLNAVQQAQWDAQFDEGVREYEENMAWGREQADIDNAYRETTRQDSINSENRAYAREDVMSVISAGGTPTDAQIEAAGMSKNTVEAMAAISSGDGDSDETIDLVDKMSTTEIVDLLETYAADGNDDAIDTIVDDLYLTGRITEEQRAEMKKKYKKSNSYTFTDTTVSKLPSIVGIPPSVSNSPYYKN